MFVDSVKIFVKAGDGGDGGSYFLHEKYIDKGGPSGGIITEENLDTPIDFGALTRLGSMMGSGGMIVMDEDDCVVDVAKFYMEFCVDESCGKCSPCRIGTRQMYSILDKISRGAGEMDDIQKLKDIGQAMKSCSQNPHSPTPDRELHFVLWDNLLQIQHFLLLPSLKTNILLTSKINAVILENVKNLFLTLLQISVLVVECVLVNVLQTVLQVKRKCVM